VLTHGSLFAGIGGFDLGFERAGIETVWTVEKDASCNQVLAAHWPNVRRHTDVKEVGKHNLSPVDIISGGFPCQDLSVAGRREGLAGERSGLWFEFARIIEEMAPQWVVVENVPGLLSSVGGADFAQIIGTLERFGYCVSWRVLDSQHFGVPQRRRRVFVIGSLGGTGSIEVLFELEGGQGDSEESKEEGERIAAPITASFARHHGRTAGNNCAADNMIVTGPVGSNPTGGRDTYQHNLVAATLNSGGNEGGFRTEPGEHLVAQGLSENQRGEVLLTDYSHQLTSGGGKPGQGYPAIAELYPTLRGQPNQGPGRMADDSAIVGLVRRLTPIECERLQGFPDGWTEGLSDSARYRCLGNAVTVNVAEWIGRRLVGADDRP